MGQQVTADEKKFAYKRYVAPVRNGGFKGQSKLVIDALKRAEEESRL